MLLMNECTALIGKETHEIIFEKLVALHAVAMIEHYGAVRVRRAHIEAHVSTGRWSYAV